MKKIKNLLVAALLLVSAVAYSQVTTSSMSGKVTDGKEALIGATVIATHDPSGTAYTAITNGDGIYALQGLRPGGPYKVEVSYVGYKTTQFKDVSLNLGETYRINAQMEEDAALLGEVVVLGKNAFERNKTGAATHISNRDIQSLPTISRSINDFTRLTPQSNGLSFAGRDGRYNYITIDGAAFNNSFGLSGQTRNLPGGDAQPISLDAIDQISVSISPYDIRQSNFTGATVNAVTKSGDNTFKGSAYTYLRPESFAGTKIEDRDYTTWDKTSKQTYGFSVGGPIIKNKLFFFVNGEYEKSEYPSTSWKASTDGNADPSNYISRAKVSDLQALKEYLKNEYKYDAGGWDWSKFGSENYKLLGRLDWNINDIHKLTVRYNQVVSTNDVLPNASSVPSGITRSNYSRTSEKAIAFTNAGYGFENTVRSITGELNSAFAGKFANKFLASYTMIRDKRTSPSSLFPFVDIWEGGNPYTSFGYELYTYNNDVKNNTFSIIDNFSVYLGNHTLTAGLAYEQQYFGNAYMTFATGYYRYNSLAAFLENQKPDGYAITYGINGNTTPYSELSFGMGSFYLQDDWQLLPNLKVTGGIRFEVPFYLNDLIGNGAINALEFTGGTSYLTQGTTYKMDVSTWPKQQLLFSPRISAVWDVLDDGQYKVRGGTGIFTGRLPFVWFTNQPTNDGTLQLLKVLSGTAVPEDMRFDPEVNRQKEKYGATTFPTSTAAPSAPVEVAKDFKMPQVWRTNLATDIALPNDMTFTLEGIYTKDINAILQQNINETAPDKTFTGSDNRPYYSSTTNAARRINPSLSNAMILSNTDKGYQYSITAQLTKKFNSGFSGMIAYTYSQAKDVTSNPGDQASSAWSSNVAVGSLNDNILSWSNFSVPHRIIGSVTYELIWLRNFRTAVSLLYQGSAQGRLSYVYTNDMNGDGYSSDLMYIPKDQNDIVFKDLGAGMSPQEQWDAFSKFMEQDDYLKNHKGEYAERFGGLLPWDHRFDFKLVQDIFYLKKSDRRVQFTFDILNLGNLLNSKWGVSKTQITGSYQNIPLLKYEGVDAATGKPTFSLPVNTAADYYTTSYKTVLGYGSTWSMLAGIRVTF